MAGGQMGMHKHAVSGRCPKSPKMRLSIELRLRDEERRKKKKSQTEMFDSVKELFDSK